MSLTPITQCFCTTFPSTQGSSSHVAVCGSNTLNMASPSPGLPPNKWYIVRHDGSIDQEVWDVTDPTAPFEIGPPILTGLNFTHHIWWECDTGIAYVIAGSKADGWYSGQHVYIFDLSNPAKPVFIRQWGLVGQQPDCVRHGAKLLQRSYRGQRSVLRRGHQSRRARQS